MRVGAVQSLLAVLLLVQVRCQHRGSTDGVLFEGTRPQHQTSQLQCSYTTQLDAAAAQAGAEGDASGSSWTQWLEEYSRCGLGQHSAGVCFFLCSDLRARAARFHDRVVDGECSPRFLIFEPSEKKGLGNQMIALSSALLAAMVSDRAFLIRWR